MFCPTIKLVTTSINHSYTFSKKTIHTKSNKKALDFLARIAGTARRKSKKKKVGTGFSRVDWLPDDFKHLSSSKILTNKNPFVWSLKRAYTFCCMWTPKSLSITFPDASVAFDFCSKSCKNKSKNHNLNFIHLTEVTRAFGRVKTPCATSYLSCTFSHTNHTKSLGFQ